jgi:DNA replication and repair protein RecF
LHVSKLKVYNFRNLRDQTVELHNGPVYITGKNGNGKTNLVEALYLLSGSRSFRTNTQTELVKWGQKEASVFGTVESETGSVELGLAFTASGQKASAQRTAYKNGEPLASIAELMGACTVVAFSPADLSLVKGAPAGRRKFLDRHMVDLQPSFLNVLMAYQRALESKSALLKSQGVSPGDLVPWNKLLTEYGGKIVDNRLKFLKELIDKSSLFHQEFAQSDGELHLALESELVGSDGQVSLELVEQELARLAPREITFKSCLFGPHRDDVAISLGGVDSRAYASQGQTRSIVLALKLGVIELLEARLGEPPIVILDDVDSELDASRTERLFTALSKRKRQLFITGTATAPKELAKAGVAEIQTLEVTDGIIS